MKKVLLLAQMLVGMMNGLHAAALKPASHLERRSIVLESRYGTFISNLRINTIKEDIKSMIKKEYDYDIPDEQIKQLVLYKDSARKQEIRNEKGLARVDCAYVFIDIPNTHRHIYIATKSEGREVPRRSKSGPIAIGRGRNVFDLRRTLKIPPGEFFYAGKQLTDASSLDDIKAGSILYWSESDNGLCTGPAQDAGTGASSTDQPVACEKSKSTQIVPVIITLVAAVAGYSSYRLYEKQKNRIIRKYKLGTLTKLQDRVWFATKLASYGVTWYLHRIVRTHINNNLTAFTGKDPRALGEFYYGHTPSQEELDLFIQTFFCSIVLCEY